MSELPLPVNVDTMYADRAHPGDKAHQQHHDTIHAEINSLSGRFTEISDRIDGFASGEASPIVDEVLSQVGVVIEDVAGGLVNDHANDENPHPVYDDGPSLFLIYENAKV